MAFQDLFKKMCAVGAPADSKVNEDVRQVPADFEGIKRGDKVRLKVDMIDIYGDEPDDYDMIPVDPASVMKAGTVLTCLQDDHNYFEAPNGFEGRVNPEHFERIDGSEPASQKKPGYKGGGPWPADRT